MKISINMTRKDLFIYSLYNSYSGLKGLFNVAWTLAWIVMFATNFGTSEDTLVSRMLMLFCILLFTVINPAMIWSATGKQAKTSAFKETVELTLDDKIVVEQLFSTGELEWQFVKKIIRLKSMYVIDMGFGRAYLIPNAAIEGREEKFVQLLKEKLPETKTKGLKA